MLVTLKKQTLSGLQIIFLFKKDSQTRSQPLEVTI